MQLNTEKRDVTTGGVVSMKQFTVKAGSHIMSILSGLYSNPVDAMVREYLTNMYDAYVALKKIDPNGIIIPPELHLPNALDPNLIFKDYGIGMDFNTVWNVFTSYGDSTKTDNDDEVGGFGLGSKTAFCYNNGATWNIESRFNGEKYIFMAFVNSDGTPNVVHVATESTDEHNGVTISIPIKREDIDLVVRSASKYITYFPMELSITNVNLIKVPPVRDVEVTSNIFISKRKGAPTIRVIMGNVPYVITSPSLYYYTTNQDFHSKIIRNNPKLKDIGKFMYANDFEFIVNVGDVDIVPSRDALKFTDKTNAKIESMMVEMVEKIEEKVSNDLANCKTEWDALLEYKKYTSLLNITDVVKSFKYNNVELTPINGITRKLIDLVALDSSIGVGVYGITAETRSTIEKLPDDELCVRPSGRTYILIDDIDKKSIGLAKGFLKSKLVSLSANGRVTKYGHKIGTGILLKTALTPEKISEFFGGFPISDMVLLSSIVGTVSVLKTLPVGNIYKLKRQMYNCKFVARVDMPTTLDIKYYLPMEKDATFPNDSTYRPIFHSIGSDISIIHDTLRKFVGNPNLELYGVRKANIADLDSTWINANTYIIEQYKLLLIDEDRSRKYFLRNPKCINQTLLQLLSTMSTKVNDELIDKMLKFASDELDDDDSKIKWTVGGDDQIPWEILADSNVSFKEENKVHRKHIEKFTNEWSELMKKFNKKYPMIDVMLSMATASSYHSLNTPHNILMKNNEHIINYIKERTK